MKEGFMKLKFLACFTILIGSCVVLAEDFKSSVRIQEDSFTEGVIVSITGEGAAAIYNSFLKLGLKERICADPVFKSIGSRSMGCVNTSSGVYKCKTYTNKNGIDSANYAAACKEVSR